MAGGTTRGPVKPGPHGLSTEPRPVSHRILGIDWSNTGTNGVIAAKIFFDTNKADIGSPGGPELEALGADLSHYLLTELGAAKVTCDGYADVRGKESHNRDLSWRRAEEVKKALERTDLGPWTQCAFPLIPHGSKGQPKPRQYWPEERRVDVTVAVTTLEQIQAKGGDWFTRRTRIFEKFYPDYGLWKSRGLEYLVKNYEVRSSGASGAKHRVEIKPLDYNKVLDLLQHSGLFPDSERAFLERDLEALKNPTVPPGSPEKLAALDEINDAYARVYERAFEIALKEYEKAFRDFWGKHPGYTRLQVAEALLGPLPSWEREVGSG